MVRKIESGEGASDFGTTEKASPQDALAAARQALETANVAAGGCDATPFGYPPIGPVPVYSSNSWPPEPTTMPVTKEWVADVIHTHWEPNRNAKGFPWWIQAAAEIIAAGR